MRKQSNPVEEMRAAIDYPWNKGGKEDDLKRENGTPHCGGSSKRAALVFGLFLMAAFSTGACLISGEAALLRPRCPRQRRRDTGWHDGMELLSRLSGSRRREIC
ncbi:MAG: hypothetical protein ACLR8L_00270 [Oscillospiraceae bacterium]